MIPGVIPLCWERGVVEVPLCGIKVHWVDHKMHIIRRIHAICFVDKILIDVCISTLYRKHKIITKLYQ